MGVWDTSTPAGSDPISQGDDRIRELKTAIQEALRGGATEGDEAVFPGAAPTTAPIFRYRGLKGTTAARPAASAGGLYYNTTTGTFQRSNGTTWDDVTENAAYEAIHAAVASSLASSSGVVTLPETGNAFNVSGTETVTSITGWSAGIVYITWSSARIITHSANLSLRNSLDRNVVAGDVSTFMFSASGTCKEIGFYGAGMGTEVGATIDMATGTVPDGFLECNGASLLRADYPALYARIGTVHGTADGTHFNLPDYRGKFKRGWAHGTTNDPDKASRTAAATGGASGDNVGSVQADEFEAHTHSTSGTQGNSVNADGAAGGFCNSFTSTVSTSTGGNETRPINANIMVCIKY